MSSANKNLLNKRFYEFKDEIDVNPETKNLNDITVKDLTNEI